MAQMEGARGGARTDGLAVAALFAGVLSIPGSFVLVGLVLGGAAFMMGLYSRSRIAASGSGLKGDWLALLGSSLGVAGFALSVAVPILLLMVTGTGHHHT